MWRGRARGGGGPPCPTPPRGPAAGGGRGGGATMPDAPQWARVRGDVNCNVRRGAWYEVVRLTPDDAVIEIGQRSLSIPRSSLQIVPVRPHRWSVVARPRDAVNLQ